ncbi:MAG: L-fucose/L-arabinose isomerase family protein [Candidatus Aminicenantales bacterium]
MKNNIPEIKLGLVAVSRDCFPLELARRRREKVIEECRKLGLSAAEIKTIVEKETHVGEALAELSKNEVNALVIYLGNFGPEGPASMLAQRFEGPVMFAAAAEERSIDLIHRRGDALCGMLSTCYNLGLRGLKPYLPQYPLGLPPEIARMIADFVPLARVVVGLKRLKIFSFGPRPQDFFTCNAPLKPLFDLGVEIMENSELDLYHVYRKAEKNPRIDDVERSMSRELGRGSTYPDLLRKLAQYEVALLDFYRENLGASSFGVFANKCWPAFESYFGFVPCYVNSRLAAQGIPVACEVDMYGVLSEYMCTCATQLAATLLDINNTVPPDMYEEARNKFSDYRLSDLFMGFHCGNTPLPFLVDGAVKYQLIMNRLLENGRKPDITRGTLEGRIRPGEVTIFRLQSTAEGHLRSYIAQGEVIDVDPRSFGSIGVFAIKNMGRFYRHVLLEKQFPHHTAVAFKHCGKTLFAALRLLGVDDIGVNHPASIPYPGENPFSSPQ